jgi:hypothetical protein
MNNQDIDKKLEIDELHVLHILAGKLNQLKKKDTKKGKKDTFISYQYDVSDLIKEIK